jgi:oligopeptide/dipeptide ABC transporter ATP-binding protein
MAPPDTQLSVEDLRVSFSVDGKERRVIDGVSFSVGRGRTLGLVGESGCGKSVTSYSILRLLQPPGRITGGKIRLRPGQPGEIDLLALDERSDELYRVRGGRVSMIFQEPMTALSPVHTVGSQICETIRLHQEVTREAALRAATEMLQRVGIPNAGRLVGQYPHELSGGMRQRVVIAMALVCRPEVLIADEPTTALDVSVQAQVLALIKDLQREIGFSVLFITHDLGVIAQVADEVAVMYLGRIVERGPVREVLKFPRHPYTRGLRAALPGNAIHGRLAVIPGNVPVRGRIPPGCPFYPRCAHAVAGRCDTGAPPPLQPSGAVEIACFRAADLPPV